MGLMHSRLYDVEIKPKITPIYKEYAIQLDVLGIGEFTGTVHLCLDKKKREKHALKFFKCETKAEKRNVINEFQLQFKASERCNNIVKIENVYKNYIDNELFYYVVMECMEGKQLFEKILKENVSLTEQNVAKMICQIAYAVKHLHSLGIAHKDLRPKNLLLTTNDNNAVIKITNFGKAVDHGKLKPTKRSYSDSEQDSKATDPANQANAKPKFLKQLSFRSYSDSKQDSKATDSANQTNAKPNFLKQLSSSAESKKSEDIDLYKRNKDFGTDIWAIGQIMYFLCNGLLSTEFAKEDTFIDLCEGSNWNLISKNAKDLVKSMLEQDYKKRFTIEDVTNSDWIKAFSQVPKTPLPSISTWKANKIDFENINKTIENSLDEIRIDWKKTVVVIKDPNESDMLKKRAEKKAAAAAAAAIKANKN